MPWGLCEPDGSPSMRLTSLGVLPHAPHSREELGQGSAVVSPLLGMAAPKASPPLQTFCSWVEKSSRKWLVQPHPPPHTPSKFLGVEKGVVQAFEPFLKQII